VATRVFVDGQVVGPEAARVSVLDRGFLYGDSVVEVMRTVRGRAVDLDAHLARLDRSARAIRMAAPATATVAAAVEATLIAADEREARVRVMVSRGPGDMKLDLAAVGPPTLVVIVEPLRLPAPAAYERGAAAVIIGAVPAPVALAPGIKAGSYLGAVLALAIARDAGADEAIRLDGEGRVVEGATSNVFAVIGGELRTAPAALGLLAGVTRGRLIELGREGGLPVAERAVSADELATADEVFLTSSVRGVMPVTRLDGRTLPVGPFTRRAMALYQGYLDSL
jgi:branched-chain amino acid aminotransferase